MPYERGLCDTPKCIRTSESPDPLSFAKYRKPPRSSTPCWEVRLIFRVEALSLSLSLLVEERRDERREDERKEPLSATDQQSFRAACVFFSLGYITYLPRHLTAECFAEITCQNTYFPLVSKFLFRPKCENVSMWQDGPSRKRAYYIIFCPGKIFVSF